MTFASTFLLYPFYEADSLSFGFCLIFLNDVRGQMIELLMFFAQGKRARSGERGPQGICLSYENEELRYSRRVFISSEIYGHLHVYRPIHIQRQVSLPRNHHCQTGDKTLTVEVSSIASFRMRSMFSGISSSSGLQAGLEWVPWLGIVGNWD